MKRSIICFFIFSSFLANAQKEITTKWYHEVLDTFHSHKNNWRSCIPFDMVEVDDDVIIGTYDWFGWTVRRIEKKTGKLKWLTAQTPDYPDNAKTNFYLDNLFLRPDGNVDAYVGETQLKSLMTAKQAKGNLYIFQCSPIIQTSLL
jgi:hypothetical protein